jgi:hypothetical protein
MGPRIQRIEAKRGSFSALFPILRPKIVRKMMQAVEKDLFKRDMRDAW